jgi:hypothetical protein
MPAIRFRTASGADQGSGIESPSDVAPEGCESVALAPELGDAQAELTVCELLARLDSMPHKRLTKEEVDQYLASERASWD